MGVGVWGGSGPLTRIDAISRLGATATLPSALCDLRTPQASIRPALSLSLYEHKHFFPFPSQSPEVILKPMSRQAIEAKSVTMPARISIAHSCSCAVAFLPCFVLPPSLYPVFPHECLSIVGYDRSRAKERKSERKQQQQCTLAYCLEPGRGSH